MVFRVDHFQSNSYFAYVICQLLVMENTHKVLIGCLSRPIDSNAPGIQLAM